MTITVRQSEGRMQQSFTGKAAAWAKSRVRAAVFSAPLVAALFLGLATPGLGQQLPGVSADQLQQLRQQYGGGQDQNSTGSLSQSSSQSVIIQPAVPPLNTQEPAQSRLEQIMSARSSARLKQFGYDQFGRGAPVTVPQTGAVQDDYVLGPGDEVVISLRGQENSEFRTTVNRSGQVVIPRLNPLSATGRNFGNFRQDVEAAVHRAYVATDAFVTIGRTRQISVLVTGEVSVPGQRLVTGLSSAVDALMLSGGVKKTGSLRSIRVQRGDHEYTVDLYNFLTGRGTIGAARLADGDRIVVPPLGRTVAVTGLVRQPGIFELAPGQSSVSVRTLLSLAGGQEVRGRFRFSLLKILPDGQSSLTALAGDGGTVRDSEILFVQLGADFTTSQATLSGGTGLAGQYAVADGGKMSDVIRAPGALGPSPYTLLGIVSRQNPRNLLRQLVAFSPVAVLNGAEDLTLQSSDIIRPISVAEFAMLTRAVCTYKRSQAKLEEVQRNPLSQEGTKFGDDATSRTTPSDVATDETLQECILNDPATHIVRTQGAEGPATAIVQRAMVDQFGDPLREVYMQSSAEQQQLQLQRSQNRASQTQQNPAGAAGALSPQAAAGMTMSPTGPDPFARSTQDADQAYSDTDSASQDYPRIDPATGLPMRQRQAQPLNFQNQPGGPGQFASNREVTRFADLARQLGVTELVLVNFLIDHEVVMRGALRGPGRYFVGPNVELQDLVQAAGGTINWADSSAVEVTSTAVDSMAGRSLTRRISLSQAAGTLDIYQVRPHDELRFNSVFTQNDAGSVTVQGEVHDTGLYQFSRGEHLSEVLRRAGGLTAAAYPYGAVFLRKSVANVEHESYQRAAKEVEDQLLVAMTRVGSDKISPDTFSAMQSFVQDLRNQKAIGRMTVVADPTILARKPDLDPTLEDGDLIYIPPRPSTVSILGEVMQPGSHPYIRGISVADYVAKAGGYKPHADDSETYVVLPDGSARKVEHSWLALDSSSLPPGSSIIVPRDVTPLDLRQTIIDVSQIFSQFAVSIASIAVLSRQ